jgi:UPF0755 protein
MLDTRRRRADRHSRRRGIAILLAFILLLAIVAGGLGGFYTWATGASGSQTKVVFVIPSGATGAEVADLLKNRGVIRSTFAFRFLAKFRHLSNGFEAGQYNTLTTNMSVSDAIDELKKGPFVKSVRVGFAEGLTVAQTVAVLSAKLHLSKSAMLKAATGGSIKFPPYVPPGQRSLEGFLFPDTYNFLENATEKDVIQRLLDQFKAEATRLDLVNRAAALHLTPYQVVIVASMIEREAKFDEDRPKIAAVIYNRLKKGMLLQIDATVEYALDKYKSKLTLADLKVQSPYNTYLHAGLPPGPIASPGYASLQAALSPAHADYLYYVVIDAAGHHYFTASYQDFLNHKNQAPG